MGRTKIFDFPTILKVINPDSVKQSQITLNSWVVPWGLKPESKSDDGQNTFPPYAELYRVRKVGEETKVDFNISAKTTRLDISGENIETFLIA